MDTVDVRMSVIVPQELREWVKNKAKRNGVNASVYIRQMLIHERNQEEAVRTNIYPPRDFSRGAEEH